jgi:predicted nicotinamide N-methyase
LHQQHQLQFCSMCIAMMRASQTVVLSYDGPMKAAHRHIDLEVNLAKSEAALRRTLPDARLQITALPNIAQMQLALINSDFQTGPLSAEVMQAVIAKPTYWAFCWGSGLALARWLLQNPAVVAGKRIADVGCGCGIGAIAAKMAGAAEVIACDNDQDALINAQANAALNHVSLAFCDDVANLDSDFDLILMADVLYDKSNYPLLSTAKSLAHSIIVADSRVRSIDDPDFVVFHTSEALTYPNLGEFDEFRDVRFFRAS